MSTVHVVPIGDLIEHVIPGGWDGHGADCSDCGPTRWLTIEAVEDASGEECPCGPTVEHRPPFEHRAGRDPRTYDLQPRPLVRRAPYGWSRIGMWRHQVETVLLLAALLRSSPASMDDARRREVRAGAVARMARLTEELLADPRTGAAPTEAFPRAEGA